MIRKTNFRKIRIFLEYFLSIGFTITCVILICTHDPDAFKDTLFGKIASYSIIPSGIVLMLGSIALQRLYELYSLLDLKKGDVPLWVLGLVKIAYQTGMGIFILVTADRYLLSGGLNLVCILSGSTIVGYVYAKFLLFLIKQIKPLLVLFDKVFIFRISI